MLPIALELTIPPRRPKTICSRGGGMVFMPRHNHSNRQIQAEKEVPA
jgi:hypothetical protein